MTSNRVSGIRIRILKICDPRLARKIRRQAANSWNFPLQRRMDTALSRDFTRGGSDPQRRQCLAEEPELVELVSGANPSYQGKIQENSPNMPVHELCRDMKEIRYFGWLVSTLATLAAGDSSCISRGHAELQLASTGCGNRPS